MELWFSLLLLLVAALYVRVMESVRSGWETLASPELPPAVPRTPVSVIVAVRNEEAHLERCLSSLVGQDYPAALREIIVVDDFSDDRSAAIAASFADRGVRLIRLQDRYPGAAAASSKKLALKTGIGSASGVLLATFDGDSWAPPGWLSVMAAFYETYGPVLLAGPVAYSPTNRFLEKFQALDLFAMTGTAAAGIAGGWFHLGNGTNLFYTREAFHAIGGFEGVDRLASGDDVFIMQKMAAAFPGRLAWVKKAEAVVLTAPAPTWKALWRQRLRWGGKASRYREWRLTALAAFVLLFSWMLILSLFIAPLAFLPSLALKSLADYRLLDRVARFFQKGSLLSVFWKAQLLHVLYIVLTGTAAVFWKRYRWKGRRIK